MKKLSTLLVLLTLVWMNACQRADVSPAQSADALDSQYKVPVVVVQAVQTTYPTAVNLSFSEVDKGNVWSADFVNDARTHQIKINRKGQILEAYVTVTADRTPLPAVIETYIQKNYPGYVVVGFGEGQQNAQKAYKVTLRKDSDEVTLIFDANGALLFTFKAIVTPATRPEIPKTYPLVSVEDAPVAIRDYLKDKGLAFAKGLVVVGRDDKKTYTIIATQGTIVHEIIFDNDGKVIKASSVTPPPAPVEIKSISELPAAAVAYLNGYTLERGIAISDRNGQKTFIVSVSKDGKRYEIAFDNAGKVLRSVEHKPLPKIESKPLTDNELPSSIAAYLNENYKGWALVKGAVTTIDGKASNYLLVIKVGNDQYLVSFDGGGKFIGVRKG